MKDDEAKRVATSDEDKMNRQNGEVVPACSSMDDVSSLSHAAQVNANGKSRNKPSRKRLSTSSPEEDIIDGFAISSFTSLEALEVGIYPATLRPSLSNCNSSFKCKVLNVVNIGKYTKLSVSFGPLTFRR